jgi:AcrR family transcriptional regulator
MASPITPAATTPAATTGAGPAGGAAGGRRARVVKAADDRRAELLDVALHLFLTRGYGRVAVQDITDAAQVAKGTFYHYFASKADLLAQVCERQVAVLLAGAERLLDDAPADAVARLRAVIGLMWGWKRDNAEIAEQYSRVLYAGDNQALRLKLRASFDAFVPLLSGIVAQGEVEGSFRVDDPSGATRAMMWLWEGVSEWMMPRLLGASRAAERASERILGAPEGSLDLSELEGLREWLVELVTALGSPAEPERSATAGARR